LEKEAEDMEKSFDNHREKFEKHNKNVIKVVKEQRQEVEKIFDDFEDELDKCHKENKITLDVENSTNNLLKAWIQGLKTEVRAIKNYHQKCKVYLKTKNVTDEKERIAESLEDLKNLSQEVLYRYSYMKAKEKIKPENFGKVTLKPPQVVKGNKISCFMVLLILVCAIVFASPIMTMMHKAIEKLSLQPIALEKNSEKKLELLPNNVHVKYLFYISEPIVLSIPHSSNNYKNDIKDSSIKEHFINSNVQVHNLTENKIIHSFHQQDINEIIKVDDKTVAVTFEQRVEFWGITKRHPFRDIKKPKSHFEMIVTKTLHIGENCRNIRFGNLFVMCLDDYIPTIVIKQLNIFGYEVTSFWPFSRFRYKTMEMTVSPNGRTIYVSEAKDHSIKSYTPEGQLIAKYKNDSLMYPAKMTVDSKGNLFVTGRPPGRLSYNIYYVSPDLTHGYELIQTDIVFEDSITYNEYDNSLYISSIHDKSIRAFKIKT
jgi:hypothetical protein